MEEYTLDNFIEDFDNRKGIKEEDKLFFYLDYAVRDENFNQITSSRKHDAVDRYDRVTKILEDTSNDVIESNIYLKKCKEFMESTKKDCASLLLDYHTSNKKVVSVEVSTENLLPFIEEKKLNNLDIVKDYNKIARNIEKMYKEINRLIIWNLIDKDNNNDDLEVVSLNYNDGEKGILSASFQEKNKDSYLGYIYKKKRK